MISLKLLARELQVEVADLSAACQKLSLPLSGEEVCEETAEILQEIGKQAKAKNVKFQQAVTILSTEQTRSTEQGDSTEAQSFRDRYNQSRYGTTQAPEGSILGDFLEDQVTIGNPIVAKKIAATRDYVAAAYYECLTNGAQALDGLGEMATEGKSEGSKALTGKKEAIQGWLDNLVQWEPKALTGTSTSATSNGKQLKPSSM